MLSGASDLRLARSRMYALILLATSGRPPRLASSGYFLISPSTSSKNCFSRNRVAPATTALRISIALLEFGFGSRYILANCRRRAPPAS